jgi:histidine triad (HIT) family protein
MTSSECPFCSLFAGGDARWVLRSGPVRAFFPRPRSALAPGHTLVVPYRHVDSILDADDDTLTETSLTVARVARAMIRGFAATGVNVLNASGPDSRRSVRHLHFHVVPRWADDQATMWPTDTSAHTLQGDLHILLADAMRPR